ncbi:MAG TPA: hypothetical protein VG870_02200 [Chitinophagaceae bacterium]|nr:hypothetical protein [Chitinophagaceae bacterium]
MRTITLSILALFILSSRAQSQAAKSIYFELGGPGLASFNFDTRFGNREDGLGGRIGFGGFSLSVNDGASTGVIFIPLGLNYLLGKDGKNYFELGAGVTPVIVSGGSGGDGNFSSTFGHLNFGYRLQPAHGGFTFRAFITPVFGSFGFIPYYGGVSFGYKFGH